MRSDIQKFLEMYAEVHNKIFININIQNISDVFEIFFLTYLQENPLQNH